MRNESPDSNKDFEIFFLWMSRCPLVIMNTLAPFEGRQKTSSAQEAGYSCPPRPDIPLSATDPYWVGHSEVGLHRGDDCAEWV